MSKDGTRFAFTKNDGQSSRAADALDAVDELQFPIEDVPVEKEQSREGLVLGRSGDVTIDRKMAQKCRDVFFGELNRVTFAVKENSPRQMLSQARLQITLPPRTFKIFLTMRCVASIETAFPVYQFEGRSFSCGHDEPGIMGVYAGWKLVS